MLQFFRYFKILLKNSFTLSPRPDTRGFCPRFLRVLYSGRPIERAAATEEAHPTRELRQFRSVLPTRRNVCRLTQKGVNKNVRVGQICGQT
jgi:hypothetical protein